jgi:polysaccharide biosynthesis transport protein
MQSDREGRSATERGETMTGPLPSSLGQLFEDGLSARALLSSIRRHLVIVLSLTLSLCVAGALVGLGQPAWFKAEGSLIIHAQPRSTAEIQELPDPGFDLMAIQSEVDLLQSSSAIEPVVRSLRLWEAPEFRYPQGWSWQIVEARLGRMWRDWGLPFGPEDSAREQPIVSTEPSDASLPTQTQIDGTVGAYKGYLGVGNSGVSMTIVVSYRALTPERAATIVNAHIDSYRKLGVNTKVMAAEHANAALTAQVTQLRQQLLSAEAAVTRYREEHHLTGASRDVSGQLAALHSQLISIRSELAENELRAAHISAGGENLPEVVSSGAVGGLRGQEVQLTAREAALAKYHGDEYPELQHVRASLKNVRDQISRQIGRDRAAALQTVERSRARERFLQQSIVELTNQLNSADAGLQQLQGNADSIKSLLLNFEKRVGETAANPAFIIPNSTIASRANASAASTSSKTKTLAFAGGFVGLTLGSLLSLLLELRDKGFRTSSEVQQHTGSLTVSATPRAIGRKRKSPADMILNDNRSAFAEAFRVSWANIHLAVAGPKSAAVGRRGPGTALGITSAASGEGKSMHALALARTAALAGEHVVLVDADLRRSGVTRLINRDFSFTLSDFLQDRCTANDVIAIEDRSGVHFVPSTSADVSWTRHDLHRFFNFVDYLKDRFATVIIDLPPIVGLADTIRLAMAADNIALIIRWGRTERQFVQFALEALRNASVSPIAAILNDIDLKALRRRGYRDHTLVYGDKGLYHAASGYREPATRASLPVAAAEPDACSETNVPEPQRGDAPRDRSRAAGSDIERLYNKYHD